MSLITQEQYDKIMDWFDEGGALMDFGCRPREAQQMMVDQICGCLSQEKPLLCEAPTGVGKTYSYLFPIAELISDSRNTDTPLRLVVSTATKGLQRQLKGKDFPVLSKMFPKLRCHTWMGASNYLCGVKLRKALNKRGLEVEVRTELESLLNIYADLKNLEHGWREELPFEVSDKVWELVQGDSPCCYPQDTAKSEGSENDCFCHRRTAFIRAKQADILCVNHSFLCTMAMHAEIIHPGAEGDKSKSQVILVIDEAHDLEDCLRRCLNQDFSIGGLKKHIDKILDLALESELRDKLNSIRKELMDNIPDEPIVVTAATSPLALPLLDLCKCMSLIAKGLTDQAKKLMDNGVALTEDIKDTTAIAQGLIKHSNMLRSYLANPTKACMLELGKSKYKNKGTEPHITFCPFELAPEFKKVWDLTRVPILTSATLFNSDADALAESVGLKDIISCTIPPPFDYGSNIKAFCITEGTKALDNDELLPWLKEAIRLSAGNALVLFTSYKAMQIAADNTRYWMQNEGYNFHMQARGVDSQELLHKMAKEPNTVIFGTNTFWTGVDIKGTNLCNVIITKLPFRMPDNFVKSYSDYLKDKRINAFTAWSIPDMINKTRQGVGRLIRTETDLGLLFLLDPRFVNSRYGNELKHRIYPDKNGYTTLKWNLLADYSDLPELEETQQWLGVTPAERSKTKIEEPVDEGDLIDEPF